MTPAKPAPPGDMGFAVPLPPAPVWVFQDGFSVHLWLSWNSLCRPGWPQTHRDPPASVSLSAEIKGVRHHPAHLGDSHLTKFSCQHETQPCPLLNHSFCVLTLREHFPEDFTSDRCWFLLNHHMILAPAKRHQLSPSDAKILLHSFWSPVNHADFSAPADQNDRILIQNSRQP